MNNYNVQVQSRDGRWFSASWHDTLEDAHAVAYLAKIEHPKHVYQIMFYRVRDSEVTTGKLIETIR